MMNTVKNVLHSLGGSAGELAKDMGGRSAVLAKDLGGHSAELAKDLGAHSAELAKEIGAHSAVIAKDLGAHSAVLAKRVGAETAKVAKRVGAGTVKVASQVGVKRGLAGLAILGAVIGGSIMLARYLKRRAEETVEAEAEDETAPGGQPRRNKKMSRAKRKAAHAQA